MALDRTTLSHVLKIPNENLGKPGPIRKVYQNLDKLIFVVKLPLLFLLVGSKNVYAALTVEFLDPGQLLLPFFLVDPISFKKCSSWSQATTRTDVISDGKGKGD
ncbi:hypothetical protein Peur_024379 [Populus x canadensis]